MAYLATTAQRTCVEEIERWMARAHGGVQSAECSPKAQRPRRFVDGKPTQLAVVVLSSGVTCIRFNAFSEHDEHEEWLIPLCTRLACRAAVVQLQSVASYGYLAMYEAGRRLRLLEGSSESGVLRSEGQPLPFEGELFDVDEDGALYLTDFDEIEEYMEAVGFDLDGRVESNVVVIDAAAPSA